MTTTATTTCPSWCTNHPANEQETHQGAGWRAYGLSVGISDHYLDGLGVCVEKGPQNLDDLTPEQAHELGLELVRAAATLRREARA